MSDTQTPHSLVRVDGLFETHLTVANLDRSVAFYRDRLGLPVATIIPERQVAFFWLGGPGKGMLGLWQGPSVLRLHLHLALAAPLDEVLAAPARLRRVGIVPRDFDGEPTGEPAVLAWMPAAAVYFNDTDEHSLEFLAMLPDPPAPDLGIMPWQRWRERQRS